MKTLSRLLPFKVIVMALGEEVIGRFWGSIVMIALLGLTGALPFVLSSAEFYRCMQEREVGSCWSGEEASRGLLCKGPVCHLCCKICFLHYVLFHWCFFRHSYFHLQLLEQCL